MSDKQNYDYITIDVDADLLEEVRPLFAQYGLTPERAAELFFAWMAKHPEEAISYFLEAKEKLGTVGWESV